MSLLASLAACRDRSPVETYRCSLRAIIDALIERRTIGIELFIALDALLSGVVLTLPQVAPEVNRFVAAWMPYLASLPLDAIAVLMIAHGIAMLAAILWRRIEWCRRAADASTILWGYPALCVILVPPAHAVPLAVLTWAPMLLSMWVSVRLQLKAVP